MATLFIKMEFDGALRGLPAIDEPEAGAPEKRVVGSQGNEQWRRLGWSDARILDAFPQLKPEDLAAAWAYAGQHRDEIEAAIRENPSRACRCCSSACLSPPATDSINIWSGFFEIGSCGRTLDRKAGWSPWVPCMIASRCALIAALRSHCRGSEVPW